MNIKSTQNLLSFNYENLYPKAETLQSILAFASTYQVEKLSNGETISYFLN